MVLNEAFPTSSQDDVPQEPPSTEQDKYASTQRPSPSRTVVLPSIELSELPRPMPLLGPLFGYGDSHIYKNIVRFGAVFINSAGRNLRDYEWQCVAYNAAKMNAIQSWGFPLGLTAAVARCEWPSVKAQWRFPFFTPAPGQWGIPYSFGPLRGAQAAVIWTIIRLFAYTAIGGPVGTLLAFSYGSSVALTGQLLDPRMKDLREAMSNRSRQQRQQSQAGGSQSAQSQDVASSGAWDQVRENMQEQPSAPQRMPLPRPPTSPPRDVFDVDDASPTAGTEPVEPMRRGESAWDRIRSGNGAQPGSSVSGMPHTDGDAWAKRRGEDPSADRTADGDSFNFSANEQEDNMAKGEAQRDFDERIEKERRGQDFNEQSEG